MSAIGKRRSDGTSIEWVLAVARSQGKRAAVWNPMEGCRPAGAGCRNCWAAREVAMHGRQKADRLRARFSGLTRKTADGRIVFNGVHRPIEADIDKPIRTKAPTVYFVCSRSDLCRDEVPADFILEILATASAAPRHTYLFLTKHPARMREAMACYGAKVPGNFWLGTSVWDQKSADVRIPELRGLAAITFVSYEPAIGRVDFRPHAVAFDWLLIGEESGPRHLVRHMDLQWPADALAVCRWNGIAGFYKQARDATGRMVHLPAHGGVIWDQVPIASLEKDQEKR